MTLQEPHNPPIADVDIPDTEVPDTEVIVVAHPSPVFVDSTGRRRRMLRRVAYGFGALCLVYGGLISVSLAGGPISSSAVLPLPDLAEGTPEEDAVVARPSPTPEPAGTRVGAQPILEVFPRRVAPVTRAEARDVTPRASSASPRPSRTPTAKATTKPAPSPSTPKPAESTSTKPTTPESPPPTTTATPPPPAPPAVDTSGRGGSSTDDEPDTDPAPPAVESSDASAGDSGGSGGGGGGGSANDEPDTDVPATQPAPSTMPEPSAEPDPDPEGEATV